MCCKTKTGRVQFRLNLSVTSIVVVAWSALSMFGGCTTADDDAVDDDCVDDDDADDDAGDGNYISSDGGWTQVSAGSGRSCGLMIDGSVHCWGSTEGWLTGTPDGEFLRVDVDYAACAIREDATLTCWGLDLIPPTGTFTDLSMYSAAGCALSAAGHIECWNTDIDESPPSGTFIDVALGSGFACALADDHLVSCWGENEYGATSPPSGEFVQIDAGKWHACGIRQDGSGECWGEPPVPVIMTSPSPPTNVEVSLEDFSTCWLRDDGDADCRGGPDSEWSGAPPGVLVQIDDGDNHVCGVDMNGYVVCRGSNMAGESQAP